MGPKTNSDSVQRGKANPAAATRWLLVVAAGLSVFMATLDMSVVAIALPAVERDLAIPTSLSEWVLLGYLLPLVALALPSGRWLDRVGTRAAFVTTAGGFAVTSVAAGLAPSAGVLVGARVIQGVFGRHPACSGARCGHHRRRARAAGQGDEHRGHPRPFGAVSGPALGGLIVQALGWTWIFYLNAPIGLLVITVGLTQLPPGGRLRLPGWGWVGESALLTGQPGAGDSSGTPPIGCRAADGTEQCLTQRYGEDHQPGCAVRDVECPHQVERQQEKHTAAGGRGGDQGQEGAQDAGGAEQARHLPTGSGSCAMCCRSTRVTLDTSTSPASWLTVTSENDLLEFCLNRGMAVGELIHLRRAHDLIDREFARPLDVPAMARAAHASPSHFARRYRQAYGETPYQHLLTRRVERAKALLRARELTVTEICLAVGFSSLGSFSARFSELTGYTPSAYRSTVVDPGDIPGCMARGMARSSRNREAGRAGPT